MWQARALPQRSDGHDHLQMSLGALGTTVNIPPGEAVHQHRHGFRWSRSRLWLVEKAPASREVQRATAIAKQAVVPNTHETT